MGRFQKKRFTGRDRSDDTPKFKKRDYSSKPSRDSKPRRNRRKEDQVMHKVTCDKCHKKCEVPFLPTESKPVYCSNCFRKGGDSRSSYSRSNNSESSELEMINRKLDRIIKALEL